MWTWAVTRNLHTLPLNSFSLLLVSTVILDARWRSCWARSRATSEEADFEVSVSLACLYWFFNWKQIYIYHLRPWSQPNYFTNFFRFVMSIWSWILNCVSLNLDFLSVMGILQEFLLQLVQLRLQIFDGACSFVSTFSSLSSLCVNLWKWKVEMWLESKFCFILPLPSQLWQWKYLRWPSELHREPLSERLVWGKFLDFASTTFHSLELVRHLPMHY